MKTLLLLFFNISVAFSQVNFKTATTEGPRPWTNLAFNKSSDQFQFAIVSDRTGGHRPGVFMDGVRKLNLLQPEFVMSVGDLIEGYTTDRSRINQEWDEFDEFVSALDMPFFYVPGNHDYINPVMAGIWKERYGPDHYYFIYENVLFLCLNSEEKNGGSNKGSIGTAQYEMVSKVLEANPDVRWTMVFMHQPLWDQENDTDRWKDVEELLKTRKHTVFVGHRHNYVAYERNNSNYYILATTGGGSPLKGPQLGQFDHFVWITMTDEGPIMANIALDGVFTDKLFTEEAKARVAEYYKEQNVKIESWTQEEQDLEIMLKNPYDFPISVTVNPKFNWDVSSDINRKEVSIPPNSVELVELSLKPRKNKSISSESVVNVAFEIQLPEQSGLPKVNFPINKEIKKVLSE